MAKTKKDKKATKMCCFCGSDTSDYIVFQNGCICKECQDTDKVKELLK